MEDKESQNDELLALQSIFEESQFHVDTSNDGESIGYIFIKPEVNEQLTIKFDKDGTVHELNIQHLYPIELHFSIPADYPSLSPPSYTLVCKWLQRDQVFFILIRI